MTDARDFQAICQHGTIDEIAAQLMVLRSSSGFKESLMQAFEEVADRAARLVMRGCAGEGLKEVGGGYEPILDDGWEPLNAGHQ